MTMIVAYGGALASVEPGDTLVVATSAAGSDSQAGALYRALSEQLPGVRVVTVTGVSGIGVYRPAAAAGMPAREPVPAASGSEPASSAAAVPVVPADDPVPAAAMEDQPAGPTEPAADDAQPASAAKKNGNGKKEQS